MAEFVGSGSVGSGFVGGNSSLSSAVLGHQHNSPPGGNGFLRPVDSRTIEYVRKVPSPSPTFYGSGADGYVTSKITWDMVTYRTGVSQHTARIEKNWNGKEWVSHKKILWRSPLWPIGPEDLSDELGEDLSTEEGFNEEGFDCALRIHGFVTEKLCKPTGVGPTYVSYPDKGLLSVVTDWMGWTKALPENVMRNWSDLQIKQYLFEEIQKYRKNSN